MFLKSTLILTVNLAKLKNHPPTLVTFNLISDMFLDILIFSVIISLEVVLNSLIIFSYKFSYYLL